MRAQQITTACELRKLGFDEAKIAEVLQIDIEELKLLWSLKRNNGYNAMSRFQTYIVPIMILFVIIVRAELYRKFYMQRHMFMLALF